MEKRRLYSQVQTTVRIIRGPCVLARVRDFFDASHTLVRLINLCQGETTVGAGALEAPPLLQRMDPFMSRSYDVDVCPGTSVFSQGYGEIMYGEAASTYM